MLESSVTEGRDSQEIYHEAPSFSKDCGAGLEVRRIPCPVAMPKPCKVLGTGGDRCIRTCCCRNGSSPGVPPEIPLQRGLRVSKIRMAVRSQAVHTPRPGALWMRKAE